MQRLLITSLCAGLIFTSLGTGSLLAEQVVVTTLNGDQFHGELVSWNEQELQIASDESTETLAAQQLLRLELAEKSAAQADAPVASIVLADGTRLPLDDLVTSNRVASFSTVFSDEQLSVPAERVLIVNLAPEANDDDSLLQAVSDKQQSGDVLVIFKNNRESIDFLTGILGDLDTEHVSFNWDGEVIPVKRNRIAALAFHQPRSQELDAPACLLTTQSGARLPLREFSLKGETLQVTTLGGLELVVPLSDLQVADCSGGKLIYLSDLQPLRQKWTPLVEVPSSASLIQGYGQPRLDSNFQGSALSLVWPGKDNSVGAKLKAYAKGLAIRSRTELEYRIPPDVRHFSAIAGIDPTTSSQGNVELRISVDGMVKFQETVDGGAEPFQIDINLERGSRLEIVVDYGLNLDFGDQLHLVEARMTK